ncbi:MAG: lipase maturation factor family protein, partial [Acidobacteriaceae bacterium]|nr:lipase maturation factor family protein [Acidobacteriaceae bacterium]
MSFEWDANGYWLTRAVFQRGLGLIYFIAFLNVLNQFKPLLGEHGLLPVPIFLKYVSFRQTPSLFFYAANDTAFTVAGWIGLLLSLLTVTGISERYSSWISAAVWAALYILYTSFVNVGQDFYSFGWESILLEAGFYAIFLGARDVAPQKLMIWMLRWLCFRVMFGAGLIKLRGDSCWKSLTCLDYHYETQPMPNPLSWFLYNAPEWTRRSGVMFNHFAELIAPFGYFLPQPVASIAGIVTIVFQASIFSSGNLSWLNALTIVLAIPMLDDRVLGFIFRIRVPEVHASPVAWRIVVGALAVFVVW